MQGGGEEGLWELGMMLWAEVAARARALSLGMSREQKAGRGGQQAWKVIRLGLSSWGVTRGAELHELFPMLCLPRLVFSGCPHVPLALSQQQL